MAPLYETYRTRVDEIVCVDWAESLHASPYLDITQDLARGLDQITAGVSQARSA